MSTFTLAGSTLIDNDTNAVIYPDLFTTLEESGYGFAAAGLHYPRDFGYSGDLDLFNTWALVALLETRDSGVLEQSNSQAIKDMIEKAGLQESFEVCTFGHWACGWVEELACRVVKDDGTLDTAALDFIHDIKNSLDDYPVLDEEDYSRRDYEAAIETLESCVPYDFTCIDDMPEGWAGDVYSWLGDNGYDCTADYINWSGVNQALDELGLLAIE